MGKFDQYKIVLKALPGGNHTFEYLLDTDYFRKIDSPEVERGKVNAAVTVKNTEGEYEIRFQLDGIIQIPCDRCLDDMEWPVSQKSRLIVKLGKTYSEESDEIIVIPEDEGEINLAWFLYEFIALSIPVKHVHAPGKCNKMMSSKLSKHMVKSPNDEGGDSDNSFAENDEEMPEESGSNDSRWDDLKQLIDNN